MDHFTNLTGECLGEYSVLGKIITAFIGLAVGIFSVPMGLLGLVSGLTVAGKRGAGSAAAETNAESTFVHTQAEALPPSWTIHSSTTSPSWYQPAAHCRNVFSTSLQICIMFGFWFNVFIFTLICPTTVEGILDTVRHTRLLVLRSNGSRVLLSSFSASGLARLFAATADPKLHITAQLARACALHCFFSIIDLLAIAPWYFADIPVAGGMSMTRISVCYECCVFQPDEFMERRPLEKLKETAALHSKSLAITTVQPQYCGSFASLLYLCMHDAAAYRSVSSSSVTQDERYQNV